MAVRTLTVTLIDFGLVAAADCRVHIEQLRAGKDSGSIVIPTARADKRTNDSGVVTFQLLPNDNHSRYHVKIYNARGSVAAKGYFDMPDSNASLADIIVFEDAFTGTAATAELIKKLTMRGDWDVTENDGLPAAVRNDAVRLVNVPSVGAPVVEGRTVVNGQTVYYDASGTWRSLSHRLVTGLWDMTGAAIACAYPFDATSGDATSLGDPSIVGAMVASDAGKTATYTVQSAHATVSGYFANYVQFNAPFPTTVDLSTGKKVVEGVIGVPATLTGGTGVAAIGARISTSAGAPIVFFATSLLDDGSTTFEIYNSAMAFVSVPGVVYPATVGVTFNAVSSTFALQINGAEVDVSSINTYTPQVAVIAPASGESTVPNAVNAADAGKTLSFTLHSSVDDITQTYAPGATDLCWNELGGGGGEAILPEGAQPEDVYEVEVAGTYQGVDFSVGDLAIVRSDGISVTRLGAGRDGDNGLNGWAPILSIETDGERRVQRVVDWTGGTGAKPATGKYVGASGLVDLVANAVDIRGSGGAGGLDGNDGWTPVFAVVTDGDRRVLQVSDWTGGEGTKPATGKYVGTSGLETLIADGVDVRGAAGVDAADPWTYVKLASDYVLTGSVAFQSTGLVVSLAANKIYEMEFFGVVDTDTATNGLGFDFSITGTVPTIWGQFFSISNTSNGGAMNGAGTVNSASPTSTSVSAGGQAMGSLPTATLKYAVMGKFICKTTAANDLTLRMCGEGAVTGQTLYAGDLTFIKFRELP